MRRAARLVHFGDRRLPILSPEHLLVCKAVFDRPKDRLDIEQILVCVGDLDLDETRSWLVRTLGADDPRTQRFEETVDALLGDAP